MRFIYIDSHGKEVSIPTVDALALRIELGAITESTRLYDEAAGRWAPASEHEIYRTLQREREEKSGGFVAPPPPPMQPPVQQRAGSTAPPASAPVKEPESAPAAPLPKAPNPFDVLEGMGGLDLPPGGSPPKAPEALGGLDFGLTLDAPPADAPAAQSERAEADSFAVGDTGSAAFDAFELEQPLTEPPPPAAPAQDPPKGRKTGEGFDFQGFGGLLADDGEDEDEADDEPTRAPAMSAGDSGMVVENVLEAAGYDRPADQESAVVGGGIDLEQPLSELPLDDQGWTPRDRMRDESPGEGSGLADEGTDGSQRTERLQRPRPAPRAPGAEKKSSPVPALIGALVVLAVVGGGGWFGWTRIKERRAAAAAAAAAASSAVAIPAISAELEPRMRELADSTMSDWLSVLRSTLPTEKGLPAEPDGDWLAGSYLADASKYASVEQYWKAFDGYLNDVEAKDVDSFAALYGTRLDSAGVTGDDAKAMLDRAQAGFRASRPERVPVYQQLRDVVQAALGLHEFLLANEDQIEYDPAAGGASRDPVLEAVPATPELGKDMWARVDKITQSLDALGALDKVTTDRLLDLFTTKLRAIPIR